MEYCIHMTWLPSTRNMKQMSSVKLHSSYVVSRLNTVQAEAVFVHKGHVSGGMKLGRRSLHVSSGSMCCTEVHSGVAMAWGYLCCDGSSTWLHRTRCLWEHTDTKTVFSILLYPAHRHLHHNQKDTQIILGLFWVWTGFTTWAKLFLWVNMWPQNQFSDVGHHVPFPNLTFCYLPVASISLGFTQKLLISSL